MQTIRRGSTGVDVAFLQTILNKKGAVPRLTVDGSFGPLTETALKKYQSAKTQSPPDGVAGPITWRSIPTIREFRHRITLFGQPTGMTCWSAATTMMLPAPMSVGPGGATTGASGGLTPTLANVETFIAGLGWRMVNNMSAPPPSTFSAQMARSPVWVVFQAPHLAHAVVFSAMITDGDESGEGTAFEVKDPWPVGGGTTYASGYAGHTIIVRSTPARPTVGVAFVAAP